jgi:hypothetical protein
MNEQQLGDLADRLRTFLGHDGSIYAFETVIRSFLKQHRIYNDSDKTTEASGSKRGTTAEAAN